MKKLLSCIFAMSLFVAMLSACGTQEDTAQAEATLNSETTASAEETSETSAVTEANTESTTEEAEPKPEISYQKKRLIHYPADGDSYVSEEYEYKDDGYYKKTYLDDGTLFNCIEYKNDVRIMSTQYDTDGSLFFIAEFDESEFNNTTKILNYYNQKLSSEMLYAYQFNVDRTEVLVTITNIFYNSDTGEKEDFGLDLERTYVQRYEYDDAGHIIHECQYDKDSDSISLEYYYEYDDNGNEIYYRSEDLDYSYTSEYDDNNNVIHRHNNNRDAYYDYDEYGRQIGWTEYDADGNETSHYVVEYE